MSAGTDGVDGDGHRGGDAVAGEAGPLAASLVVALLISAPMTVGALRGTTSAGAAMTAFVATLAAVWALAALVSAVADAVGRSGGGGGRTDADRV